MLVLSIAMRAFLLLLILLWDMFFYQLFVFEQIYYGLGGVIYEKYPSRDDKNLISRGMFFEIPLPIMMYICLNYTKYPSKQ